MMRILSILLLCMPLAAVAQTTSRVKVSELPRTNSATASNLVMVTILELGTNGSQAITVSNLANSMAPYIPGSGGGGGGGSATNAIVTVGTNGVIVSGTSATNLNVTGGTNTFVTGTNSGGNISIAIHVIPTAFQPAAGNLTNWSAIGTNQLNVYVVSNANMAGWFTTSTSAVQFTSALLQNLVTNPRNDWTNQFIAGTAITLTTNSGGVVTITANIAGGSATNAITSSATNGVIMSGLANTNLNFTGGTNTFVTGTNSNGNVSFAIHVIPTAFQPANPNLTNWSGMATGAITAKLDSNAWWTAWGSLSSNSITAKLDSNVWAAAWGALATNALTAKLDSNAWWNAWGSLSSNAITGKLDSNVWWSAWGSLSTNAIASTATNATGSLTNHWKDVAQVFSGLADGQVLKYVAAMGRWTNGTDATGGGGGVNTNANQFGAAGATLTLSSGLQVTNVSAWGLTNSGPTVFAVTNPTPQASSIGLVDGALATFFTNRITSNVTWRVQNIAVGQMIWMLTTNTGSFTETWDQFGPGNWISGQSESSSPNANNLWWIFRPDAVRTNIAKWGYEYSLLAGDQFALQTNGNLITVVMTNAVGTNALRSLSILTNGQGFAALEVQTNGVRVGLVTNVNWNAGVTGYVNGATAILGAIATGGGSISYTNFSPITNALAVTNPVVDWNGPTTIRISPPFDTLILFTNYPALGSTQSTTLLLEILACAATNITWESKVSWLDAAPSYTKGVTNTYWIWFDGTNYIGVNGKGSAGGGGGNLTTNSAQFAGVPLSIASGVPLTNVSGWGSGSTFSDLTVSLGFTNISGVAQFANVKATGLNAAGTVTGNQMTSTNSLSVMPTPANGVGSLTLFDTNGTYSTIFQHPLAWKMTNQFVLQVSNAAAGQKLAIASASISAGVATMVITNQPDGTNEIVEAFGSVTATNAFTFPITNLGSAGTVTFDLLGPQWGYWNPTVNGTVVFTNIPPSSNLGRVWTLWIGSNGWSGITIANAMSAGGPQVLDPTISNNCVQVFFQGTNLLWQAAIGGTNSWTADTSQFASGGVLVLKSGATVTNLSGQGVFALPAASFTGPITNQGLTYLGPVQATNVTNFVFTAMDSASVRTQLTALAITATNVTNVAFTSMGSGIVNTQLTALAIVATNVTNVAFTSMGSAVVFTNLLVGGLTGTNTTNSTFAQSGSARVLTNLFVGGLTSTNSTNIGFSLMGSGRASNTFTVGTLSGNAGSGSSNFVGGGVLYWSTTLFTNLNALSTASNLAFVRIGTNTLQNNGDSLIAVWRGKLRNAFVSSNQFVLKWGTGTVIDTGVQATSNETFNATVEITRTGASAQHVDAFFEWGTGAGAPWSKTNISLEFTQTDTTTNDLFMTGASSASGAHTNNYFKVYYYRGN